MVGNELYLDLTNEITKSPGVFNIIPTEPNKAEQVEIRAIYLKDNAPFGNYSAIYTVSIAT